MREEVGEVAGDFEHVAMGAENHEGTRRRHVLESYAARELVHGQAASRRAADLHRLGIAGAAVVEHLAHRDAERVFVDARRFDVTRDRQQLGAGRLLGAEAGEPGAAPDRDQRRLAEGLDVVHHRRLTAVARVDREGRANARDAALAFERLEQRRFLAADVGAGPEVDVDVEGEIRAAAQRRTEQAAAPAAFEILLQCRQQIGVLAAQVQQPLFGTNRHAGDAHAVEHEIGMARQQDAILEGAGLPLVGVADHVARGRRMPAGRPTRRLPLDVGGKARATAAAQVGNLHFGEHRLGPARYGCLQRFTGWRFGRQHRVAAPDVVGHHEVLARPLGERHLRPDQLAEAVDALCRHARHCPAVDQQRRALVAHAGAGGGIDADQTILGKLAALDPQFVAQAIQQVAAAQHAVGDVVRKENPIAAHRRQMQERVEAGDSLDACTRHSDRPGDQGQSGGRQVAQRLLRLAQNLYQFARIAATSVEDRQQQRLDPPCIHALVRHDSLPRPRQFLLRRSQV